MQQLVQAVALWSVLGVFPNSGGALNQQTCAAPKKNPLRLECSVDAMGTTFVIEMYGTDEHLMQKAADQAFVEVRRLDISMTANSVK